MGIESKMGYPISKEEIIKSIEDIPNLLLVAIKSDDSTASTLIPGYIIRETVYNSNTTAEAVRELLENPTEILTRSRPNTRVYHYIVPDPY